MSANIVQKLPFKLFPVNKNNSGLYSYYKSSPIITFDFNENVTRLISSGSLFLCGKFRLINENGDKQMPANRFDVNGSAEEDVASYEEVAYIDDRIAVNSVLDTISVSNMRGSMVEQAKNYHRNMASSIGATTSYKDLCSYQNMSLTACANNDVIAREISGDVEFALPLKNGYFTSNPLISLERGLSIKVNLAPDSQVIYGLSGQNYKYELQGVFLMGDYLVLDQELKGLDSAYSSFYNFQNVMNSSNDHNNINIQLQNVNTIYHNFVPSEWSQNDSYNSFSTCPILNDNDDYEVANIKQFTINRGAIRYPNNYSVDEAKINKAESFQALRSRQYLDAIYPYCQNKKCLISPDSEKLEYMVDVRQSDLETPQTTDQGLVKQWVKTNNGAWSRNGDIEKASHVYGIGARLDGLFAGASSNYSNASYNYSIESDLDNEPNNVYIYTLASTEIVTDKLGNQVAVN